MSERPEHDVDRVVAEIRRAGGSLDLQIRTAQEKTGLDSALCERVITQLRQLSQADTMPTIAGPANFEPLPQPQPPTPSEPIRRFLPNDTVANRRFVIVQRIGVGGMGEVYEAIDKQLSNAAVALKFLPATQVN